MKMEKMTCDEFEALTIEKQIETIKELFLPIGYGLEVEIHSSNDDGWSEYEKTYNSQVIYMNEKLDELPIQFYQGNKSIPIDDYSNQIPFGEGNTIAESLYSLYEKCFTCIEHKYYLSDLPSYAI